MTPNIETIRQILHAPAETQGMAQQDAKDIVQSAWQEARILELERALSIAHDQMSSWFSSEYAEHPTTKQIRDVLYKPKGGDEPCASQPSVAAPLSDTAHSAQSTAETCASNLAAGGPIPPASENPTPATGAGESATPETLDFPSLTLRELMMRTQIGDEQYVDKRDVRKFERRFNELQADLAKAREELAELTERSARARDNQQAAFDQAIMERNDAREEAAGLRAERDEAFNERDEIVEALRGTEKNPRPWMLLVDQLVTFRKALVNMLEVWRILEPTTPASGRAAVLELVKSAEQAIDAAKNGGAA